MKVSRDQHLINVHPTAIIDDGVELGNHTVVWDSAHIRRNTHIGHHTVVGEKCHIAYDVRIGNYCNIKSHVAICTGVFIEDMVYISSGVGFANDRCPRAMNPELTRPAPKGPSGRMQNTVVGRGVTIGTNATIGPGIKIGEFAMIGMGAVATRDVPPYALAAGNPARVIGWVCVCGPRLVDVRNPPEDGDEIRCGDCDRRYLWSDGRLTPKDAVEG